MNTIIYSKNTLIYNIFDVSKKIIKKKVNSEKYIPFIIPNNIYKNYRLPKNDEVIIKKEKRNKQRIIDRNRDISPYKNYYQQ